MVYGTLIQQVNLFVKIVTAVVTVLLIFTTNNNKSLKNLLTLLQVEKVIKPTNIVLETNHKMSTKENGDLNNSYNEDDIIIHRKILESKNEWENKICACSSTIHNNSSDDEESFSLESSPRMSTTRSSQNLTILSPNEEIFGSPEKYSTSNPYTFDKLSFEQKGVFSEEKIAELKLLMSKVNDEFVKWKVNEFLLETIKTKSTPWAQQIRAIIKSSEMQNNIHLKSENGDFTNLLGLEEEDIKLSTSRSLALFSKPAFFGHAVELVRANAEKLKLQKKSLQDEFGSYTMKAMVGMMSRERAEQLELYKHVEDKQNQVRQLLSGCHTMTEKLSALRKNSDRNVQKATLELLKMKASYLHTVISCAKEKLDQGCHVDENLKKKLDTEGDNLKTQVTEMKEELKALQKTLAEYEKKEADSAVYKNIIAEYGNLRKQLQHKYQTLNMLNDPNMSF